MKEVDWSELLGEAVSKPGVLSEAYSRFWRYSLGNQAIMDGERLLSAYHLSDGTRIWIITEADRSVTTVLLPEEY